MSKEIELSGAKWIDRPRDQLGTLSPPKRVRRTMLEGKAASPLIFSEMPVAEGLRNK